MSAATGRGSTRGRGRGNSGRGGAQRAPRGNPNQGVPIAAQLRQLDRLQEPDEMSVIRRYAPLGAEQVRSTYGRSGLLAREVLLPASSLALIGREVAEATFVSVLEADNALRAFNAQEERARALARRAARLPGREDVGWEDLSPEERRILLLSQKDWQSFRAPRGGQGPPQAEAGGATAA